jgi:hypothetical protein
MFAFDTPLLSRSLLYRMATSEDFLLPLRAFKHRRLYANLHNDFVVPLGTAGIFSADEVTKLRRKYRATRGIVATLQQEPTSILSSSDLQTHDPLDAMRAGLNSLGWEKTIVYFPGLLPIAHNTICALNRKVYWFLNEVFAEGRFVMDHAAEWLCPCDAAAAVPAEPTKQ